jgi:hypothetical protein
MRTRTIPKESTTPRCHELFLLEKHTMTKRKDHPQLEMVVNCVMVDGLYLLAMIVVDLLAEVVKGLQEVAIVVLQEVEITIF